LLDENPEGEGIKVEEIDAGILDFKVGFVMPPDERLARGIVVFGKSMYGPRQY